MKKLFSFLAMMLLFAACQTEPGFDTTENGLVTARFSVGAHGISTRADEATATTGFSSALGAIDNFTDADWANYNLRFIFEVYAKDDNGSGDPIAKERQVKVVDSYKNGDVVNFEVCLVPNKEYKFVVFADFVDKDATSENVTDLYYDTTDLRKITMIDGKMDPMDEARDAYFVSENLVIKTDIEKPLTLTRPFGKIRVVTTDYEHIAKYAAPAKAIVTYYNHEIFKSFNAVNGQISTARQGDNELKFEYDLAKDKLYTADRDSKSTDMTLFADYLLARPEGQSEVNFILSVYDAQDGLIKSNDFNLQIPIERNHLTTIEGNLLTTQTNIKVTINDDLDELTPIVWKDAVEEDVESWENGQVDTDGNYEFVVNGKTDSFLVTVNNEAVVNGKLTPGTYTLADKAAIDDKLTFTVKHNGTRAAEVNILNGQMIVEANEANEAEYTIDLNLHYEKVEGEKKEEYKVSYNYTGEITIAEPLATPVVEAKVEGNVVTLTWEAVEGAAQYGITVGTEMPVFVEETTYVFTGEYETEYTFNVVAISEDNASEPATVTVTTEKEVTVKTVTVAEFLAAAEDDTMYQLTGVITSVTNTTYGNFYLKDATGEVLIYGLCSPEGAQKYWAESGAKVGDTITVQTVRTSYNGSPQGKNAIFVELVPFVETASEWGVVGDLTGWADGSDIVMYNTWKAENLFVAYNVEIASGAFKIRANNEWNDAKNYGLSAAGKIYADKYYTLTNGGGSQNITPMDYGTYDVYFDLANERVALVTSGKEYADAENGGDPVVVVEGLKDHEWGLVGSFNGWDVANYVVTEVQGDWAVAKNVALTNGAEFKFAADKDWKLSYGAGCDVNVGETYTTYENGGNMKFVGEDGAYDFYFSLVDAKFYMTAAASAPVEPTYTTVAEFLAADVDDATFYTLKGTITRVANTSYGNFDLTDETGTIYVYGLYSEDGATNKYWAASGAQLGDDIVISAVRAEYNGSAQAGSARFLGLTTPGTLAFWSFSKTATTFTSAGGEQVIDVEAYNLTDAVSVASDNAQFTASYADGALTITAAENTTAETINGNITVTAGALEQVITVAQGGVSVGGGTEVTAEATMKSFGWANSTGVSEAKIDDNVTVKFFQGGASTAPAYYTSGEAVRLYQNGAYMTVSANGKAIKSMEITFANNMYYVAADSGELTEEASTRTWTGDATEVKITCTGTDKNHRAYIAAIKVTYVD